MRTVLRPMIAATTCALCLACAPRSGIGTTAAVAGRADAPAPDTGRVAVGGGTLYYEVRGRGPSVVLLHAGGMDLGMWDPQADALARSFRVIRYDARGHGRSTAAMGPYSTTEDLRAVLDHLGVRRADLVGSSMGAGVAFDFALTYPDRVSKLALVSTSAPPPGVPVPPGAPPPLTQEAGRARLRTLSMPRLLVVGERDTPDHLTVAERVEAEVPEVRVVRVAGGGHTVNRDAAAAFTRALLRFLQGK